MDEYRVLLKASAAVRIEAIEPRRDRCRLRWRIAALIGDPRPAGIETLPGYTDRYRLRHGGYRVVYRIDDSRKEVIIVAVGYRRR